MGQGAASTLSRRSRASKDSEEWRWSEVERARFTIDWLHACTQTSRGGQTGAAQFPPTATTMPSCVLPGRAGTGPLREAELQSRAEESGRKFRLTAKMQAQSRILIFHLARRRLSASSICRSILPDGG